MFRKPIGYLSYDAWHMILCEYIVWLKSVWGVCDELTYTVFDSVFIVGKFYIPHDGIC